MNRIIPPDDFPDAWEAGVRDYLARQFDRDLSADLKTYKLGLEALEAESQAFAGKGFTELNTATQDAILTRMETGQVTVSWPVNPTLFFQMVIEHVMEGYYSDPGNGGNRDSTAWKMIGFTGQRE
jgi:hypothetical protein